MAFSGCSLYSAVPLHKPTMPRAVRLTLLAAVPITLLVLLPLAVYGIDRASSSGKIPRNISVAGVAIGGSTPNEAAARIEAYEQELRATPATVVVEGTSFEFTPAEVELRANVDSVVATALKQRSHGFFGGFIPWVTSFADHIDLTLDWSIDTDALERHFASWEQKAIDHLAYEGSVSVVGTDVEYEYPAVGEAIDRDAATALVAAAVTERQRHPVALPLAEARPVLTRSDIDAAVAEVERMLGHGAVLLDAARGTRFVLERDQLAKALRVDITEDSDPMIEVSLDQDVVDGYLAPVADELAIPPVNVGFDIDTETDTVSVVPSQNGRVVDPVAATEALLQSATDGISRPIPYKEGAAPLYPTEAAEAWGPLGLVSEFTTNTPGVERVHNIHLMADTLDGHVVWPGERFSINETVGQRTEEGGYLRDGAIIKGDVTCCDDPANVGGGVSQYGTTFYNAVFFGCYEDILHQPHSLYISRYPEGREATLGYPLPDVIFRNDTDAPVIIRNTYTDRTITVKFYGNNGGRVCTSEKSERFNFSDPKIVYEANPAVEPGSEVVTSKGSQGFSVTVTRVITMPDGRVIREPYTHRYHGALRKIDKNPCDLFADVPCPVQVPNVVGMSLQDASVAIDAAGFLWRVSEQSVTDPAKDGVVLGVSPNGKQNPGTTITLTIGVLEENP
jgi:vancomycin resistance protein YoaR